MNDKPFDMKKYIKNNYRPTDIKAFIVSDKNKFVDNVLINAIGQLENVSIVGRGKDGEMFYASSLEQPSEIVEDLYSMKTMLDDYVTDY